ncbi:hypothetical protein SAMN05444370_102187 [Rubrimonas cliftonensis]|uniref:Uncharacterized protein n=1 Tax=Rubrimonas cliftonensis TaxID=89524 RepID=A0A1H3WY32_9RHOB|nr:hypothetical protein SAMN05444370_102187 [Rubrimonas cliftonensis]
MLDLVFEGRVQGGVMRMTGRREDRPCVIELKRF